MAVQSAAPSLLTFPGVVLRQALHAACCRLSGVRILDVRYFRYETPSGYVLHEAPRSFGTMAFLALAPLAIHTVLALGLGLAGLVPGVLFERFEPGGLLLLWLAVSIGVHAFPTRRDADHLWELTRSEVMRHGKRVRLAFPLLAFLRLAHRLSLVGFDLVYGAALGLLLPWWILSRAFPAMN